MAIGIDSAVKRATNIVVAKSPFRAVRHVAANSHGEAEAKRESDLAPREETPAEAQAILIE